MNAIERVAAARAPGRATAADYIGALFTDFYELHGDRRFGDDAALIAGIGRLDGRPVSVLALDKGHDTVQKVARNFGCAHPEGYRKAQRQLAQAEKFNRPVVCLVDTAGAYCGIGAEERGQGQAIAESLHMLAGLRVPVLSVIIGEGGSGGALALALADEVWMLENAVYSVISPEGCASILWKDAARAAQAAQCLKLTAPDLLALGIIERIIPEHGGDFARVYADLRTLLGQALQRLCALEPERLLAARYEKFRRTGAAAL